MTLVCINDHKEAEVHMTTNNWMVGILSGDAYLLPRVILSDYAF